MTSFVRSLDKLKPLYFHWRSAYGHQTWKDGNLSWWAPTHKVTKTINTWSCKVSWQSKTIISPLSQLLWLPKLGRLVIYFEELQSIYWHDLLFTWSCEITWQTKNIISLLPQTWQGLEKPWGALIQKVPWSFNHVVLWGHGTN